MSILSNIIKKGQKISMADMPKRMQTDIKNKQIRSEKIISWLQLAIVTTFFVLYLLSSGSGDGPIMATFAVPTALAIYLAFTLGRIFLAYKEKLPWWFLVLSCFMDIAILYILIMSFAFQYAQPPSFVLKAPTLLYVFIFITLRALRFDYVYVLVTGFFAAAGWSIVVERILYLEGDSIITRDYVEYLTSNMVLIGAEFDKIISITLVTIILAVASVRSRSLLFRAVQDNFARSDMSKFFTADVADKIVEGGDGLSSGSGERLEATVLNVDIRGFTKLSAQLEVDELMRLLSEYQGLIVPIIEKHGGSIDKFMGDGILASFGTGADSSTYARNAVLCIEEILTAASSIQALDGTLRIGAALASGSLIYGVIGSADRLEYTCIGETVNLSAKLEKYNSDNHTKAVCDRATLELAKAQGLSEDFPYESRTEESVAGVLHPMEVIILQR